MFKKTIAKVLVLCMLAGIVSWFGATRHNTAKAAASELTAYGSGEVPIKCNSSYTKKWNTYSQDNISGRKYYTYYKATVYANTICGYIKIDIQPLRDYNKVSFDYGIPSKRYSVYRDGFSYSVSVTPVSKIECTIMSDIIGNGSYTASKKKMVVYPASELMTVDFRAIWSFGTVMNTNMRGSNPNQPEGGIYIFNHFPINSSMGSSGYSVSIGIPPSISQTISIESAFCKVKDRSNSYQYGVTFDYKKWTGDHKCDSNRQNVVFGNTTQMGSCSWYTTDSCYKLPIEINYSMTLCTDSKSTISELATFTYSFSRVFEWK